MVESQSELVATMREVLSYVKGQVITIAAQVYTEGVNHYYTYDV